MLKSLNVATPATALTGLVPLSWAPGAPVPLVMTTFTLLLNPFATLEKASNAVTFTPPDPALIIAPAAVLVGCPPANDRVAALAGFTVTGAVCVIGTPLIVADTVFVSALVEESVPVATPLAFVVPAGCVRLLLVPVAARTTVAPWITFPPASFAVTVIVEALAPLLAVIVVGAALTMDVAADTGPGVMSNGTLMSLGFVDRLETAFNVYVPTLSSVRSAKVATPPDTVLTFVPPKLLLGPLKTVMVMVCVLSVVTVLPMLSVMLTTTPVGLLMTAGTTCVVVGCTENVSRTAGAGVTLNAKLVTFSEGTAVVARSV